MTVPGASSKRVLVVDDEPAMRAMLGMLLRGHGYEVSEAEDGKAALGMLREDGFSAVLSDVRMPRMDGLELLRAVRVSKNAVPFIVMSAFVDLDVAIEAMKLGAQDYISKPFKNDEILLKIRMLEERTGLEAERARLVAENEQLRGAVGADAGMPASIIGKSEPLRAILAVVRKVADYKSTVLLLGESGTGKELVARALHDLGNRRAGPFVPINCGAIPEALLESELFGYVKGAFTDATRNKKGLAEEADGGTLFLDEIGELPLALQVKLLRFLQEEEIRRVGDVRGVRVDVRVVAATARDLSAMVATGTFREDLYYRLNVLQVVIPPLRDRRDDVPLLVDHFVAKYRTRLKRESMTVNRDALRLLMDYPWPGNVRELENTIERAMVLADGDEITPASLPDKISAQAPRSFAPVIGEDLSVKRAMRAVEKELITRALERTGGNRTRAAELLELSHRALLYKLKDYGIR